MPTTDADLLRKAAALIRERAEAASGGPWKRFECECGEPVASAFVAHPRSTEHIASWHPEVALAVADWLTVTAWWLEDEWPDDPDAPMDWANSTGATAERMKAALTVARTYLGADHA